MKSRPLDKILIKLFVSYDQKFVIVNIFPHFLSNLLNNSTKNVLYGPISLKCGPPLSLNVECGPRVKKVPHP